MPWTETSAVKERIRFISDYESGLYTMTELCERFGVSRQTGYKWIHRYREEGAAGLEDRSRSSASLPAPNVEGCGAGGRGSPSPPSDVGTSQAASMRRT